MITTRRSFGALRDVVHPNQISGMSWEHEKSEVRRGGCLHVTQTRPSKSFCQTGSIVVAMSK